MTIVSKTIHITNWSSGKRHHCGIKKNEVLGIVLNTNAGIPYRWEPFQIPQNLLVLDRQDELLDHTPHLCGGPASRTWYFKGVKTGLCSVVFELKPMGSRPPGGVCTVHVQID